MRKMRFSEYVIGVCIIFLLILSLLKIEKTINACRDKGGVIVRSIWGFECINREVLK